MTMRTIPINTNGATQKKETLYDELRNECQSIDIHMRDAELEVMVKEEDAFLSIRFEKELSRMQALQASEIREFKVAFQKSLVARSTLQKSKRSQKQLFRDIKKRDQTITEQEETARATQKMQIMLSDKLKGFEQELAFVEEKHEKQRKQMIAAQERKSESEKMLFDLETGHLKPEIRSALAKNFNARLNHQKTLDKRMMDHQRELQLLELRQLKERADLEERFFEETQTQKINQSLRLIEARRYHVTEMHLEKDRLYEAKETFKISKMELIHTQEWKKLVNSHRTQIRQMRLQHQKMMKQRKAQKDGTFSGEQAPQVQPQIQITHSKKMEQQSSNDSLPMEDDDRSETSNSRLSVNSKPIKSTKLAKTSVVDEQEYYNRGSGADGMGSESQKISPEMAQLKESIVKLTLRQKEDISNLLRTQREEHDKLIGTWATRIKELESEHAVDMLRIKQAHAAELQEMINAQEREIQMEASVHETELKMLLERRLLNSVLDTVVDAIITIDPIGTIKRFNAAAEKMFGMICNHNSISSNQRLGYKSEEILEKNIRSLMPERFSKNHDEYLHNYITTGVKKVIGVGRRAYGLHKLGEEFPLHLSISEVKDDSVHLFTGIVRDMTKEVEAERQQEEAEKIKILETQKLKNQLETATNQNNDLYTMLIPAPFTKDIIVKNEKRERLGNTAQSFDNCSVLVAEFLGIPEICAAMVDNQQDQQHLEQFLEFVTEMFKECDEVISRYDAYKVETSADTLCIVTGLLTKNQKTHSIITANLAIELVSTVSKYKLKLHDQDFGVQIRIGLSTGRVNGGIIGLNGIPKHHVFGEPISTAEKLQFTSLPNAIHVSEAMFNTISAQQQQQEHKFQFKPRAVDSDLEKGKIKGKSYWLTA
ncbi:hypothetical protein HK098_004508 [Nowakowskiella sp. JEL0407]|nr:hypothetical protein HK098_004508 [Nowakowskiella sp. JEL0407]